jgi:hypothetical protein
LEDLLSRLDTSASAFEPDLFNTEAYAKLHASRFSGIGIRSEHFCAGQHLPVGIFQAMQTHPGVFASPGRGPYGGFDMDSDQNETVLADFVVETEAILRGRGAHRIELVLPPFCYAPHSGPRGFAVLCRLGYCVTRQELNQAIEVVNRSLTELGDYANRKRLSKAARAGVLVRELAENEQRTGYDAILEKRLKKNRSLSMSWEEVQDMIQAFPTRVRVFGAEHQGSIIAAAICLAVSCRVLYVYAWGERVGAEPISPISSLAAHIFDFARRQEFALLDLGTSSVDGVVNRGLLRFKRSLGATSSLKLWLEKSLP